MNAPSDSQGKKTVSSAFVLLYLLVVYYDFATGILLEMIMNYYSSKILLIWLKY